MQKQIDIALQHARNGNKDAAVRILQFMLRAATKKQAPAIRAALQSL